MIFLNTTLLLATISCNEALQDSSSLCHNAEEVEWSYWAQGFFSTYCNGCHSSNSVNRFGAPEQINFDSESEVLSQADAIYSSVVLRQTMPKGGGIEERHLESLTAYLHCWGTLDLD